MWLNIFCSHWLSLCKPRFHGYCMCDFVVYKCGCEHILPSHYVVCFLGLWTMLCFLSAWGTLETSLRVWFDPLELSRQTQLNSVLSAPIQNVLVPKFFSILLRCLFLRYLKYITSIFLLQMTFGYKVFYSNKDIIAKIRYH